MRFTIAFFFCLFITSITGAQTALDAPLPEPLEALTQTISINHFPNPVYASTDKSRKDFLYFWKHNTTVLAQNSDLKLIECGAYIFYNKQWNLRVSYSPKEFAKLFNCPKGEMKQGQVYTFTDNWRTDNRLMGGWAMWYFIAENTAGEQVCGYSKIETVGSLKEAPTKQTLKLNKNESHLKWTGKGVGTSYTLSGSIKMKSGSFIYSNTSLQSGKLIIDMKSIDSEMKMLTKHLKGNDFFEVKKYPEASFELPNRSDFITGNCPLEGILTIKGISEPILIPGKFEQSSKGWKYTGKVSIDRTKYGIQYNSTQFFKNLGDQAIADDFDLEFELFFEH